MPTISADELSALVSYTPNGLVPVIAQQHDTGEVLMMAWMNQEALKETLKTGRMCYYSRSRQCLWRKGETSGHVQRLKEMRIDCDGDTLLALIDQTGAACHTGNRTCFYRGLDIGEKSA
jgi:phosphoribosyl-AMP cyclohydrolase